MARRVNWSDPSATKPCPRCKSEFNALGNVDDSIGALLGLIDYLNMHDGTMHGGLVHEIYSAEAN